MLNLTKGEYLGSIGKSIAADGLIISTTDYLSGNPLLHAHENVHLSFVLKGKMIVGRKRHSGLQTAEEQFSFIQSGELHQTHLITASGKNINLEIEPAFLKKYDLQEGDIEQIDQSPGASLMMLRLYHDLENTTLSSPGLIEFNILSLLANQTKSGKAFPPAWVNTVRELLNDEWQMEFSLQRLSEVCGVHPVTISKNFQRYFGCGLTDYRMRIRLERAVKMIALGKDSLTSIAFDCGFFDQSHFIKSLKAATGMLPKHLRLLNSVTDG